MLLGFNDTTISLTAGIVDVSNNNGYAEVSRRSLIKKVIGKQETTEFFSRKALQES